jgi:alpha 1,2-mannosyltransferase
MINDRIWKGLKVKGAIYMLIQENDLNSARATIRSIEDRFHSNLNTSYPYIILSSQLMKPDFKMYLRKAAKNPEKVFFGQIDLEAWSYPYWVDSNRAENAYQRMKLYSIKGGSSPYYHHAQRYVN